MQVSFTTSDLMATIAIIVSIASVWIQLRAEKKRSHQERITELYNQAYKELLMRDLPIAMMGIRWTVNGVAGTETFSDVCKELYKNSGFFQFYDEEFFQAVREKIMDAEDYALNFDNNEYTRVAFDAELVSLRKRLRSLYKLIMDRCL